MSEPTDRNALLDELSHEWDVLAAQRADLSAQMDALSQQLEQTTSKMAENEQLRRAIAAYYGVDRAATTGDDGDAGSEMRRSVAEVFARSKRARPSNYETVVQILTECPDVWFSPGHMVEEVTRRDLLVVDSPDPAGAVRVALRRAEGRGVAERRAFEGRGYLYRLAQLESENEEGERQQP